MRANFHWFHLLHHHANMSWLTGELGYADGAKGRIHGCSQTSRSLREEVGWSCSQRRDTAPSELTHSSKEELGAHHPCLPMTCPGLWVTITFMNLKSRNLLHSCYLKYTELQIKLQILKIYQNMAKETTVTGCRILDWLMEDRLSIYKIRMRTFLIIMLWGNGWRDVIRQ
jgi:hypothetical protein